MLVVSKDFSQATYCAFPNMFGNFHGRHFTLGKDVEKSQSFESPMR